jgi:apolipoprotein N-acyltransferase
MLTRKLPPALISLFAGAILPLAYAPYSIWGITFVSIIALLYILEHSRNLKPFKHPLLKKINPSFLLGFIYGIASLGVGVSWVFNSIYDFSELMLPIAVLSTAAFILFFALLSGLWAYSYTKFFKATPSNILLAFPILGVLSEWLRANMFSGFPWLLYGYSQIDSPLHHLAPLVGIYGVSLAALILSAAIYLYSKKVKLINSCALAILGILMVIASKLEFIEVLANEKKYSIALCQSNLTPIQKATTYANLHDTWELYSSQVMSNLDKDLIIWPEQSVQVPLPFAAEFIDYLDDFGKKHNLSIIIGILKQDESSEDADDYLNGLKLTGMGNGEYYKRHLVPFGEYLPFKKILRPLMAYFNVPISSIVPAKSHQLITLGSLKMVPAICYEITFADFIRQGINKHQANVIVNISEDGWFGNSWGPHQHLEITRMRALENGSYVLRATTTGLSAIIDYKGKILAQAEQFTKSFVAGEISQIRGQTPWSRMGQWPLLAAMLMVILVLKFK